MGATTFPTLATLFVPVTSSAPCRLHSLNLVDLQYIHSCSWGEVQFSLVRGLEDARLYWAEDHWQVYGTLREHRWDGLCQIATARLDHDTLVNPQRRHHPFPDRPEKPDGDGRGSTLRLYMRSASYDTPRHIPSGVL